MKITAHTSLACSIDRAWESLHTPTVFRDVSAPFTRIAEIPHDPLPARFSDGGDYTVRIFAFGMLPLGRQIIRIRDRVDSFVLRTMTDAGQGLSGPLSLLRDWNHEMALQAQPDGTTTLTDTLRVRAGILSPLVWPTFRVFWWWRHLRLRRITRFVESAATTQWNSRYAGASAIWSGKVNDAVAAVASTLSPGSCLDVGCGEGGDALWLAEAGWRVTGLDASSIALFRAATEQHSREKSSGRSLDVTWAVRDVVTEGLGEGQFDLVTVPFLHLDPLSRQRVWEAAVAAVAPGGTLLVIGHDRSDAEKGVRRPPVHLLFDEEELRALIPREWSSVSVTRRPRQHASPTGESLELHDIVLVATR